MEKATLMKLLNEVLPKASHQILHDTCDHILSLGLEDEEDLQFVQENDLITTLNPIQARKLVKAWTPKGKIANLF